MLAEHQSFDPVPTESPLLAPYRALAGKVVVVTGSASGIGRATVRAFASLGCHVVGIDVDSAGNARLEQEILDAGQRAEMHTASVADRGALRQVAADVLERHGAIQVLFNNAGAAPRANAEGTDDALWDRVIALNLSSVFDCTKAFLPGLKAATGASVVVTSSIEGLFGSPDFLAYAAAKGALHPLTHAMAEEFGALGIRFNCIAPGGIGGTGVAPEKPSEFAERIPRMTPLRRRGTPEEAASLVVFLGCDASSYLTGTVIPIDGGRTAITAGHL